MRDSCGRFHGCSLFGRHDHGRNDIGPEMSLRLPHRRAVLAAPGTVALQVADAELLAAFGHIWRANSLPCTVP